MSAARGPLFELRGVSYAYPGGRAALDKVDLDIAEGARLAILGANGSGKSTLLKLIDGLIFPAAGALQAFGRTIDEQALEEVNFNAYFRRRVAFVFQDSDIQLFSPTVFDEVAFGPLQLDISPEAAARRADDVLEMLDLSPLRDRQPHQLSGGEKKKVAIAAVLAIGPDVLLLDEPTNNLDPRTRAWLLDLLLELGRAGKTIILATQDLDMAADFADAVVILNEGHQIAAAGPAMLLADTELLVAVNLLHEHWHRHGRTAHSHTHSHLAAHEHEHLPAE
ncbi:MAG: ABC transporter ATP-binding protein [Actinomycetota bacterium]|nr:ABC transporter ATP-binding protein [Actinomycetota bacterium]